VRVLGGDRRGAVGDGERRGSSPGPAYRWPPLAEPGGHIARSPAASGSS
jgi:hypothetical protein